MDEIKFVVAVGTAFDGLVLFGPFDSPDNAAEAGETSNRQDWNIVELIPPTAENLHYKEE